MSKLFLCIVLVLSFNASVLAAPVVNVIDGESKAVVMILRPAGEHFSSVVLGMSEEIDGETKIVDVTIDVPTDDVFTQLLKKHNPKTIVVMENKILNAYKKYQANNSAIKNIPVVAVAALFIDQVTKGMNSTTGVLYEIPAVTSLVNLRNTFDEPVRKIGVLYREQFEENIAVNIGFAAREKIKLIAIKLPKTPEAKDVEAGLKTLKKAKVDGIWITNDSGLLKPQFVGGVWIPFLKGFKKPVVVGVETLIKTRFNIGNYVVFPDHYGLGAQAASIVMELMDNDWVFDDVDFQQPISVKKHVNTTISSMRGLKIKEGQLSKVDKVVE